ncbi:MAG TPA: hypothetical protein VIG99_09445 [Myxococcaceae bacterium]
MIAAPEIEATPDMIAPEIEATPDMIAAPEIEATPEMIAEEPPPTAPVEWTPTEPPIETAAPQAEWTPEPVDAPPLQWSGAATPLEEATPDAPSAPEPALSPVPEPLPEPASAPAPRWAGTPTVTPDWGTGELAPLPDLAPPPPVPTEEWADLSPPTPLLHPSPPPPPAAAMDDDDVSVDVDLAATDPNLVPLPAPAPPPPPAEATLPDVEIDTSMEDEAPAPAQAEEPEEEIELTESMEATGEVVADESSEDIVGDVSYTPMPPVPAHRPPQPAARPPAFDPATTQASTANPLRRAAAAASSDAATTLVSPPLRSDQVPTLVVGDGPPKKDAFGDGRDILSPSFLEGEHRVIIHTVEGQVKRGVIRNVDLMDQAIPLEQQAGFPPERIPIGRVKAIFFMTQAGVRLPAPSGEKIRVTFRDGRQVAGFSNDYKASDLGFFMVPADTRTNTARIYVFRSSVQAIASG